MGAAAVSVIIPTYNGSKYLRDSIASVRAQNVPGIEIIVVDDASSDGTADAVESDPFFSGVRLLRHPVNRGPGESRRTGVRAATGDYVAFLDADDVFEPEFLERAIGVMRHRPLVGLVCCDGLLIDADGAVLNDGRTFNQINAAIKRYPLQTGIRPLEQIFLFSTIGIGFLVRREVFERVNYPAGRRLEDYEFQLDVAASGVQVYYLGEPLARYRMHSGNSSGPAANARMTENLVACLERARDKYDRVRRMGRLARHRIADVRMDLAIVYLRSGRLGHGCRTLARAIAEYPPQALSLAQFTWRFLLRRSFA